MLKFLTDKLRTQSINENNCKDNEDCDSGTESDDEVEGGSETKPGTMDQRTCIASPAPTGCSTSSPVQEQHDAHSSEEELEVINNATVERLLLLRPLRSASSAAAAEKRKWSQRGESLPAPTSVSASYLRRCSPENEENIAHFGNLSPCSKFASIGYDDAAAAAAAVHPEHSSDEEVHALLTSMPTPLQFRTSPPLEALKPGGRFVTGKSLSLSPPAKLMHYVESPRKRCRHTKHVGHLQRPYLDFEKMQQLKARSVTSSWRHRGDQGGELTLFCW